MSPHSRTRRTPLIVVSLACAAAGALALAAPVSADHGAASAAAASPPPPYTLSFDSAEVNNFLGLDNGMDPAGTETSEYTADIPLTADGPGVFDGTGEGAYTNASGTITANTTCSGGSPGTTTEEETSGNPAPVEVTFEPGAEGEGGSLVLTLGSVGAGGPVEPTENYTDSTTCTGISIPNTTPRWIADFTAEHQSEISLQDPFSFDLSLDPGTGDTAATYTFLGQFTNTNLTSQEATTIDVTENPCVVPDVVNDPQASAETALQNAGCSVGTVTKAKSPTVAIGDVISSSPVAGTSLQPQAPVALVVSSGNKTQVQCKVPDVKGKSLASAKRAIDAAHCALGTVKKKKSSTRNKGKVLSQSPPAGTVKPKGAKVDLTLGK